MKFRVERDVLAEAVAWAARSLPQRPPVPVLAGLLLEADGSGGGTLRLSSFDYEVSARVEVEASVGEDGRALVSGRLLADIARSLPPQPVEFASSGGAGGGTKVVVTCGSARFTLLTLPDEEYPALPDMPGAAGTFTGAAFAGAVAQVAVAAGRDDTLPVLTGVRVEIEGDAVTLAATDRYRLAVRTLPWSPAQPDASSVALVPARTLTDTAKALAAADEVVVALAAGSGGEGLIGFDGAARRTTSRLLDGEFPKYRSLLPSESSSRATVHTAGLVEAVKRVALVAERNTPVRLAFTDGEVRLEAGTGDEAQASESLQATLEGDPITIAFNPGYLLDGLGAIDASYARMSFTAPTRPAVITGAAGPGGDEADGDGEGADAGRPSDYRYLLMPVRLSG
ncbi:DNA polymerase III subunit beta [Vallicoccus soli]|uniref:Beta sliding clamp n=1 Tax=Vallicoccus soli TaxID=2339232 RepID=A0A3A3YVI8_9ACTN|nr:DNA polymerase III subunit beta [Vallicoccus soli]RJK94707.1 DNA polymerase III subunit beta [Vallicoccus soli]